MSVLQDQLVQELPSGISLPDPIELLYKWIEDNGLFRDFEASRSGFLYPPDKMKAGWTDTERPGGTNITFSAYGDRNLVDWFGHDSPDVRNRLCQFARTGAEGSMGLFWLDEQGQQRIVHLGSGSGSTMCCVLADDPVDFLRLLAIGYDEICWGENLFANAPNSNGELFVHPNTDYQNWVADTFGVTIPDAGIEIVQHPYDVVDSPDPFYQWVQKHVA